MYHTKVYGTKDEHLCVQEKTQLFLFCLLVFLRFYSYGSELPFDVKPVKNNQEILSMVPRLRIKSELHCTCTYQHVGLKKNRFNHGHFSKLIVTCGILLSYWTYLHIFCYLCAFLCSI